MKESVQLVARIVDRRIDHLWRKILLGNGQHEYFYYSTTVMGEMLMGTCNVWI